METTLTLLIPVTFVLLLVVERVFPGRPLPKVKGWLPKAAVFFVVTGALNAIVPALVAGATARFAPVSIAALGTVGSAFVAFALGDLAAYAYHRAQHVSKTFWLWTHQMHHSAERVDIAGAIYFHPFDLAGTIAVTTVVTSLLGVGADAAALAGFIGFLYAMFQHLNVKTPRWLGYVVMRPEQHSIHHERGVHAYNYANFPLWDIAFGTFRNPEGFSAQAGFWDGASARVGAMLLGRDVSEPLAAATAVHVTANGRESASVSSRTSARTA